MSNYNTYELESRDIDVFCKINGYPVHIATMGSRIPMTLRDREYLRDTRRAVLDMDYSSEFVVNREGLYLFIEHTYQGSPILQLEVLKEEVTSRLPSMDLLRDYPLWMQLFSWSFVEMARRGFYSFAFIEQQDGESQFLLVASPAIVYDSDNIELKLLTSDFFNIQNNNQLIPLWKGIRQQY